MADTVRLGAEIPKQLHSSLKEAAKSQGKLWSSFIIEVLSKGVDKPKEIKVSKSKGLSVSDPEVQKVIDHFEVLIGDHTTTNTKRQHAKALIDKYGVEQVVKGIEAAAVANGQEYAPSIASVKQLHEKWISLKAFVNKTVNKETTRVFR